MRRLASSYVTLWFVFVVPSLLFWVPTYRLSARGPAWFDASWHWLEDLLAFPLLFTPLTDPAWRWLDSGDGLAASGGFLILISIWAVMLTTPLIFVAGWWVFLSARLFPSASASLPFASAGDGGYVPYISPPSTLRSPLGALYLVTIPAAAIGLGIQRAFAWLRHARVLLMALLLFTVSAGLIAGWMALVFGQTGYWERGDALRFIAEPLWFGYLDTLHVPRLFHERWVSAYLQIREVAADTDRNEWPAYMGQWYRHAEFRTVVLLTAVRHGLLVVTVYLGYRLLRRLVS